MARDILRKMDNRVFVSSSGNVGVVQWFACNAIRISWSAGNGTDEDRREFNDWIASRLHPHELEVTECVDPDKEDEEYVRWDLGREK